MNIPADERQFRFWVMRRNGTPNIAIANLLGISRQAVSRALLNVDKKIGTALEDMAHANQIAIETVNLERGILLGRSIPFQNQAIIFVSVKHGMQVWYEHEGNCNSCQYFTRCIELLWDYADELGITIKKTEDPTKMADELFAKLKETI